MEWAFRLFKPYELFKKDEVITKADIWLGDAAIAKEVLEDLEALTSERLALGLGRRLRPPRTGAGRSQAPPCGDSLDLGFSCLGHRRSIEQRGGGFL